MSTKIAFGLSALLLLMVGAGAGYFFGYDHGFEKAVSSSKPVTSFDECVAAGYPVRELYPEQCATPDGAVFTRPTEESNLDDEVFCTQDALECPDGSYVGRTGPNCEFAPCPGPSY